MSHFRCPDRAHVHIERVGAEAAQLHVFGFLRFGALLQSYHPIQLAELVLGATMIVAERLRIVDHHLQRGQVSLAVDHVRLWAERLLVTGPSEICRRFGNRFAAEIHGAMNVAESYLGAGPVWRHRFVCGGACECYVIFGQHILNQHSYCDHLHKSIFIMVESAPGTIY